VSLRRQFVLVFVAFSVALSGVGGWLAWRHTSRTLEEEMEARLTWVAGAAAEVGIQSSIVLNFQPGDEGTPVWRGIQERLRRLQRYVSDAYVFRRDNTALVTTAPPDSVPVGTPLRWLDTYSESLSTAWGRGQASTPRFQGVDGEWYKYGFVQVEQSDAMLGVRMRADFLEPLNRFRRSILVGSGVAAVLAALLAAYLATNVTGPLNRLSRVALRIQRGHWEEPVSAERGDEIGRLSRAMERMRQGIVQRDEHLRLMLAQVAHEIRNPLGGVELFAAAAEDADDPSERRRLLGRVRSEVKALNLIINDFLTFARPLEPDRQIHDLREPVRRAVELMELEMAREGGTLRVDLPDEPLTAKADPDHVKRVTLNLLRNAREAGECVEIRGRQARGQVVISVRDDGPGVPEELRDRVFEPFVTDKEQGAGLGLAIVRRVTEANGGRVELYQEDDEPVGEGAEFRIYFSGAEELSIPPSDEGSDAPGIL